MKKYFELPKASLIYVFRINDPLHEGCLKIGETTFDDSSVNAFHLAPNNSLLNAAARTRIDSYTRTAAIPYELLYTETALYSRGCTIGTFNDKDVHQVLRRSGVNRKKFQNLNTQGVEWFETDLNTVKRAIKALKEGRESLSPDEVTSGQSPIVFRPEQRAAIDMTLKRFKSSSKVLWDAKMRFGKTLSALQVVKERQCVRTLILTHRPVVDKSWFEDFQKIFYDCPKYRYGSKGKGETFENLERLCLQGESYVYFASMQDLRGSGSVGGKFEKNDALFSTKWDLVIVDEAHEGTQTQRGQAVLNELIKKETKVLELSGTAFNLYDDYKEEDIYTWDYIMEQKAKAEWDLLHFGDPNPYACLPKLNIFTYNLGEALSDFVDEDVAFNFREFFKTNSSGSFVHEAAVRTFLDLLVKTDEHNQYPFSTNEFRSIFRHTLWVLPGVKAAKALSKMLQEHPVFYRFRVVNVAGEGDDDTEGGEALEMVNDAIGDNPDETRTITLSCGRLTTGVSVPSWMGVLMLSGSYNTSAKAYMQTIFRVQTPATINGRMKENCYVFDFAPDRTLQVLATVPKISAKPGKTDESQRRALGEFLNFCPVIACSGSKMVQMNETRMLQQLKKAYVERVVRNGFEDASLYNDELMKLQDVDLKEFEGLQEIIGTTKAMPKTDKIDINNQGLTQEEYDEKEKLEKKPKKERSEEELKRLAELKEKAKKKQTAISILRGISIRMPLLIYGAEIHNEDEELTIDNFTSLVDPLSWEEFMPRGVTKHTFNKFKKYYDAEIFSAAAKRIRAMARAADKLSIEDRISRIASIFATFRNPDKETVLTPWRVVNMHMGDTLGGYSFYDESFAEELEEPRYIDKQGVTHTVFSSSSRLLEINSKSGLYPLYLTYNVYRSRVADALIPPASLQEHQTLWDQTVKENIFVICKTPMAKSITRRTLMGFRPGRVNTRHFEDLINQIKHKSTNFIEKVVKGHSYWKSNFDDHMKFNAVVGNPPYQVNDGSGAAADSAIPVYQHFVAVSKQINADYISLIMPSKWMVGGRGLKTFRQEMCSDFNIKVFCDYENSSECFPNQHIDGGICYFLRSKTHCGNAEYYFKPSGDTPLYSQRKLQEVDGKIVRDIRRLRLIEKTKKELTFSQIVSSTQPYGIRNYLFNNPERYPNSRFSAEPFAGSVSIWGVEGIKGGARRKLRYVSRSLVTRNESTIDAYKLFFTTSYSTNAIIPPEVIVADKNVVCTETFLLVGPFNSKEERDNCYNYMHTKLFRVLLHFGKGTMHVNKDVFSFIPLIDFSTPYTDEDLAKLFNLDADDISYIDSHFR